MKALKRPGSQPKPRRRAQLAELLLDVSNKIALAGNLNESFDVLAQIAASAVNADRASIFLSDAHTGELCTRAISGKFTRELRMLNHLGIAGHVCTGGCGSIGGDQTRSAAPKAHWHDYQNARCGTIDAFPQRRKERRALYRSR